MRKSRHATEHIYTILWWSSLGIPYLYGQYSYFPLARHLHLFNGPQCISEEYTGYYLDHTIQTYKVHYPICYVAAYDI